MIVALVQVDRALILFIVLATIHLSNKSPFSTEKESSATLMMWRSSIGRSMPIFYLIFEGGMWSHDDWVRRTTLLLPPEDLLFLMRDQRSNFSRTKISSHKFSQKSDRICKKLDSCHKIQKNFFKFLTFFHQKIKFSKKHSYKNFGAVFLVLGDFSGREKKKWREKVKTFRNY